METIILTTTHIPDQYMSCLRNLAKERSSVLFSRGSAHSDAGNEARKTLAMEGRLIHLSKDDLNRPPLWSQDSAPMSRSIDVVPKLRISTPPRAFMFWGVGCWTAELYN